MKVSGLGHFSVGQPVPNRDHAVCVSLPKVSDLVGYEEKKPETIDLMKSGYPRFVRNHRVESLANHYKLTNPKMGTESFFFTEESIVDWMLNRYSISEYEKLQIDDIIHLRLPKGSESTDLCRRFQQNTGSEISSRHAEDILYRKGIISRRELIHSPESDANDQICEVISKAHGPEIDAEDVLLASSGANAFFSVFKIAAEKARLKNKRIWIQLGWLYLDTLEAMQLVVQEDEEIIALNKLEDFDKLISLFKDYGGTIAGVVTEFPTNPLMQSFDIEVLHQTCQKHQAILVIDPTMVSPKNAKVSSFADVVVNSLTKYANWEGDVMMGSLVFPKRSILGRELMHATEDSISRPFNRDLERMAEQISFYDSFIEHTNLKNMQIAEFLIRHPQVKQIHWAYQSVCSDNYRKLAGDERPGCVVSFEIKGDFECFYDSLEMLKSPSFGTEFSLCCPYVYLAHYSMTKSVQGRQILTEAGISPQLLRLSVGLEPVDEIIEVLKQSLDFTHSKS